MRRFRSWFALAHIIAETSRLRADNSGDEQQADVRPHALGQKPPAAARNRRASYGNITSQEGTLFVRSSPRLPSRCRMPRTRNATGDLPTSP
jgi:hypothetical protein